MLVKAVTRPTVTISARSLCNKYRVATALARAGSYRAGLDIEAGFFEPAGEQVICPDRPDRDDALGAEFIVDCF